VSLHGPIAAKFLAPLPPRKPAELIEAVAEAPLPPARPVEFALAAEVGKPANPPPPSTANGDLIAAMLEHGKLPRAITHDVSTAPPNALALADTAAVPEPPERPAILARAAALSAPLPPPRPAPSRSAETSIAPRTVAPSPTEHARKDAPGHGASLSSPYGDLILDAFNASPPVESVGATRLADGLRGTAQ
jgi:hypothetical protein